MAACTQADGCDGCALLGTGQPVAAGDCEFNGDECFAIRSVCSAETDCHCQLQDDTSDGGVAIVTAVLCTAVLCVFLVVRAVRVAQRRGHLRPFMDRARRHAMEASTVVFGSAVQTTTQTTARPPAHAAPAASAPVVVTAQVVQPQPDVDVLPPVVVATVVNDDRSASRV